MTETMTPEQPAAPEHLKSWMAALREKAEAELAAMG